MATITSYGGWLLDRAVHIDAEFTGFAGHTLRCSSERRHVIAAYLSCSIPARNFDTVIQTGLFLSSVSHDEILRAAFGSVPVGYRGALARGGSQPFRRRYYGYLHALMLSDRRPSMTHLITKLPTVDPTRLRVARALPADIRHANLVTAIKDHRLARDLADLIQLLEGAGSDRKAMAASIASVTSIADLRKWARRWAFHVRLPQHPIPSIEGYKPIETGEELRRLAVRHRNCSRN